MRHTDLWERTERPKTDPYVSETLVYNKGYIWYVRSVGKKGVNLYKMEKNKIGFLFKSQTNYQPQIYYELKCQK